MEKDTIFVLDAYGLIYRSYFAFISKPLTNSRGENVSALFGFFKSLHIILNEYKPKLFAVALDSKTPTFRHKMYPEYKATRNKTPDDLYTQIDKIEEILAAMKLPMIRQDGFEADDIIASVSARARLEDRGCVIISGDKDLAQLIDGKTTMLKPGKVKAWEEFGRAEAESHWGIPPELMLDYLSLIGDTSDNVPGVKGIGPKTAVSLLEKYGSLDGVFEHTDGLKGALKTKIEEGKEAALLSKELIKLRSDVPIEKDLAAYSSEHLDQAAAAALFLREELPNIARLYAGKAGSAEEKNGLKKTAGSPADGSVASADGQADGPAQNAPLQDVLTAFTAADLPQNSGTYKCVADKNELFSLIDKAIASGAAAYDCETTGLNPMTAELCGFSLSFTCGEGYYFPLKAPAPELGEEPPALLCFEDAQKALSKLFGSKTVIVMHNGKFDIEVAKCTGLCGTFKCTLFDTMIAAWLLDPGRSSYGMDSLAESVLGVKTLKYADVVKKGEVFSSVPLETASFYAAEDADITLRFYEKFAPLLKTGGLESLFYTLEMPVTFLLADMEIAGIYLKKEELITYSKELGVHIAEYEKEIYSLVGHEFNIASPKQLQEVLFTERKLPTGKKTKTGYSTDTSVLEELAAMDPVPAKILDYRALTKLKSTYTDSLAELADPHGRIHTSFIQTGTATGRLSSRDPNLQNIPIRGDEGRKIRAAFQAEKGNELISADYAQIELVILAHLSGDKNLTEAFNNGIDVHAKTASLIFGIEMSAVTQDMRRIAKTINFGVMYGMSSFRLANQLRIPRGQAADFIKTYFATYAGVTGFMDEVCRTAEKTGYVQTIMGRRRLVPTINSKNKVEKAAAERIAVNTPIQGSAADIVKKAMIETDRELCTQKLSARLLLQVHDELIFECPKEETGRVKAAVKEKMENVIKLAVPLRVSIESGLRWGDFH